MKIDGFDRFENFAQELRRRLRALPPEDLEELIAELRAHVQDSAGPNPSDEDLATALERLGSPADLAAVYAIDRLLARAEESSTPWQLLRSFVRLAATGVAGFSAFLGLAIGYLIALSFFLAALIKPFFPSRTGLWHLADDSYSLRLGLGDPSMPMGSELLGWAIVPIGLVGGLVAASLTRTFARACLARFRKSTNARLARN